MEFVPELLGAKNFPKPVKVDWLRHLGALPSGGHGQTHVMIAQIHHFQAKEKIL